MTPAQTHAHGLVIPSPPQLWLGAMLRAFAELVLYVVSTFRMRVILLPRECHTDVEPDALPEEKTDTQQQEEATVAASDHDDDPMIMITTQATCTESFSGPSRESRLAHHRDHQLTVPLVPTKVGTQGETCGLFRLAASIPYAQHHRSWIPTFVGRSGDRSVRIETAPA